MALENIYKKASLVMKPAAMKEGKLYSQQPHSGDGDFTFSRANGTQTRVNKHGLIENVADNTPRLSYQLDANGNVSDCPVLLLEPTRTNNLLRSEEFDNASWTKFSAGTGINPVATANYTTAPDGSNNADRVVFDKGGGTTSNDLSIIRQIVSDVGQGVSSVYIKSNTSDNYIMAIDEIGLVEYITVTPQWQRFTYSETSNDRLQISLRGGVTSDYADVSIWGAQMEAGSYPTSYIPTSGSAVTRTADDCTLTGFSSNLGQTEGVLFIDMDNFGQAGTSYGNFLKIYEDGDSTDRVIIQNSAEADNRIIFVVRANSSSLFQPREDIPTGRNKIALKYKSGDIDVFLNGTKIETSSSTFTFANTLNKVQIEQPNKVYQAIIFNEALSDSELIELTS